MYRAIKVRLENDETIEEIMESYPKLSEKEKKLLLAELEKSGVI